MPRKFPRRRNRPAPAPPPPPPLTESEVVEAERDLGIAFPPEYREYLLNVSAGGEVETLYRSSEGWRWQGRYNRGTELQEPFPHPDSWAEYELELFDRHPEPEDFPSTEAFEAACESWRQEAWAFELWQVAGTFVARSHGCTFNTRMAVSGPLAGTMWWEDLGCAGEIVPLSLDYSTDPPLPMTFREWLDPRGGLMGAEAPMAAAALTAPPPMTTRSPSVDLRRVAQWKRSHCATRRKSTGADQMVTTSDCCSLWHRAYRRGGGRRALDPCGCRTSVRRSPCSWPTASSRTGARGAGGAASATARRCRSRFARPSGTCAPGIAAAPGTAVRLFLSEAGPVVEVRDRSEKPPVVQPLRLHGASGRGLAMVQMIAAAWGCNPLASGGKAVYAVLRTDYASS
ncbi:SMI1/KNR4 family protein [Actinomadura parmotrematis]|uniref:Knr4/Smi1-like domain-containing protein n=1 Tax=Actinomadura parmotrematis TaxID=2864039 RepID=A0ABS7FZS8_9ACTN|nr:SMI1/KNR4 family protein [Actinomadura parmotrematis]MBW8485806.1 hypothetical protein [Actinomadura parmotrematis]